MFARSSACLVKSVISTNSILGIIDVVLSVMSSGKVELQLQLLFSVSISSKSNE